MRKTRHFAIVATEPLHPSQTVTAGSFIRFMLGGGRNGHPLGEFVRPPDLDGRGSTIGSLDSGVDNTHPMLNGKITGDGEGDSPFGHGTTGGALINGDEWLNDWDQENGTFGIAPGAQVISYKILFNDGTGTPQMMADGIWAAIKDRVDIISIAAGSEDDCGLDCAVLDAVKAARQLGLIVISAAGNNGPAPGSMACPARHSKYVVSCAAATVGFTVDDDGELHRWKLEVAEFSGRSQSGWIGDIKGPGGGKREWLWVPTARDSFLERQIIAGRYGTGMKGTSVTTFCVAGYAALELQRLKGDREAVWNSLKKGAA